MPCKSNKAVNNKENIVKKPKKRERLPFEGPNITILADLSIKTMEDGRLQNKISKELNENNCKPRILQPGKISQRDKSKIKTF